MKRLIYTGTKRRGEKQECDRGSLSTYKWMIPVPDNADPLLCTKPDSKLTGFTSAHFPTNPKRRQTLVTAKVKKKYSH
jgi:hypothetical protein